MKQNTCTIILPPSQTETVVERPCTPEIVPAPRNGTVFVQETSCYSTSPEKTDTRSLVERENKFQKKKRNFDSMVTTFSLR
jgi:hypothetical protein